MAMRKHKSQRPMKILRVRKNQFKLARHSEKSTKTHKAGSSCAMPQRRARQPSIFDSTADNAMDWDDDDDDRPPRRAVLARRHHATNSTRYTRYIDRLSKKMFPGRDVTTARAGKVALNDFANEMFECITELASHMVRSTHRQTLTDWDIRAAVRMALPPALACEANSFAMRALHTFRHGNAAGSCS